MLNASRRLCTITFLMIAVAGVSPAAAQSGPVAAYGFNETSGLSASDATGNGRTGTVSGATWTTGGRFGGALSFDGVNDRVNIADHALLDLTTGMTLEAWVYPTALSGYRTVILKERPGELAYGLYANEGATRPAAWIAAGMQVPAHGTTPLPINTWTHLAATYDGSVLRLFVNGVQVSSQSHVGSIFVSASPLRVGGNAIWGEYFAGRIDEVRIYARALSSTEILADMLAPVVPPDVTPPTITITNPAPDATVAGTLSVTATANDAVGVSGVQFFVDGTARGAEDTSAPYSISIDTTTLPNGPHQLTARARDAAGNTTTSTAVNVTVSNIPRLVITLPTPGSTFNSATIPVTYTTAGDLTGFGVDHVHFHVDGGPERMDTSFDGVYQLPLVPAGTHVLTGYLVRGDHSKIDGTDAAPITFSNTVPDVTAPTVAITQPLNGASINGTFPITAYAADDVAVVGVQFLLDGATLGAEDTTAPFSLDWPSTSTSNATHILSAIARDAAGNTATAIGVAITVDNQGPTVAITAPASGATVSGVVTVTADATDGAGVAGVQFLLDGAALGAEDTSAPYAIDWTTTAGTNGAHAITARARDNLGNTSTAAATVTVANPPRLVITAPAPGSTVDSGTVPVTYTTVGDLAGFAVDHVHFQIDGGPERMDTTMDGIYQLLSVPAGTHVLTGFLVRGDHTKIEGTDAVPITFSNTVPDITAPTVTLAAPANGATVSGSITISADASDEIGVAGVQFLLDGASLGAEDTVAPYALDWATTAATSGAHILSAIARDAAGNTATANGVAITVDNQGPTVVITAPASGATVSGTVTVTADAADAAGVAGVQFLLDGAPLGVEDTTAPYGIDWTTAAGSNGPHTITARASDAFGNISTIVATVTVANPPRLVITAPASGSNIDSGTVPVAYTTAGDLTGFAVDHVHFQIDGGPERMDTSMDGVYELLSVPAGTHVLTGFLVRGDHTKIEGTDATPITFSNTVPDTTAPTVALTAPANGATVSGSIAVAAVASDDVGVVGVQFLLDGAPLGSEDTTAPYTLDWPTTAVTNGSHTLSARARDAADNQGTAAIVTITVNNDSTAPAIAITSPASGANLRGTVTISADATDTVGVVGVQFLMDGASLGAEDVSAPYAIDWVTTSAANGAHTLAARARDAAGNIATATSVNVTVDNLAPTVGISAPAAGATVNGTITVAADASDASGVVGVQFLLDGAPLGAEDLTAPYSVSWATAPAPNGPHTLAARARDAAGNVTTSAAVAITVNNDTTMPVVAMTAPVNGAIVNGTISVSADATDDVAVVGVQFLLDGAPLGAEDTTPPYAVSWTTNSASNGAHTLGARARDAASNQTTSSSVTVTVDNQSPTVSVTSPASGAIVNGTITVTANAADANGVVGVQFLLDGVALGAEDTTAPYAVNWATTGSTGGTHTLAARARDIAGNITTSANVSVTVSNNGANLVAAYAFDEGAGTSAGDSSGNNLNGTITAATWTTSGRYGKALTFNGTSALVTVADHALLDLSTGMTLEAWVYPTALSGYRTVILKERPGDLAYAVYASEDVARPSAWITAGSQASAVGTTALPLNTWTHLAATYDGATLRLYVNGTQVGSQARAGSLFVSANPLRIGGNNVWGEYFAGRIDEVRVYSRALSAGEIQADMTLPVTPPVVDSTPPTVAITSPAAGSPLLGTVSITASATDNVGVAGVQFQLDGANLGGEDTTSPYSISWNTTLATIGPHTLTAIARDAAGNSTTSTAVAVTVVSSTDPSFVGQWSAPFELGVVAVNMALMHTGSVLMFSGTFATTGPERVWNPTTGTFSDVPLGRTNLFCAGHSQLSDGRLLVIGGHDPGNGLLGSREVNIFDPLSQSWTPAASMADPRWYPTATTLGDGRVLALSGGTTCLTCIADIPEVYDPITNQWTRLTAARLAFPYYPFSYLLPDGRVLNAGANEQPVATRALNLATQTWTMIDPVVVDGHSSAMYRPGQIIKSGTATDSGGTGTAAATAYVIDMNQPSPTWRQVASMANARAFHNTTILPTGEVLITGGGTRRDGYDGGFAVRAAELWSPVTETWRTLASAQLPRLYHSGALLLPDARVLIAGGGNDGPAVNYTRGEIYSPPYLFKGPRPVIASLPAEARYGQTFVVDTPDADAITSIALIRPGAVTHGFDEAQRFMTLTFTRESGRVVVDAPPSGNVAPPGYYMVFLLVGEVPSRAEFIRLPAPADDHAPPTPPAGLSAISGLNTATLNWTASTDDTAVAIYNVHRSTNSGFTPTTANRIARIPTTSYIDTVASGTYYYLVTAEDANANVSTPSNVASVSIVGDVTPPSVSIDSPADAADVTGTIAITATATDNIGVVGVQFELDGVPVGAEDLAAPYSITWPSSSTTNGVHTLTAVARDAEGNQGQSIAVTINVSNIQTPGLVAAYGFEELSGSVVNDVSGNGNHGQMTNAVRSASGRYGRALSFNGTNSIVSVTDTPSLDLTTGMTLSAWVRPGATTGWRTVVLKERASSLSYALYSHSGGSQPAGFIANPVDTDAAGGSAPLNTWTHLALTYDGTILVLYVNGVEVDRTGPPGAILTSAGALSIGGNNVWGEWFNGLIDEVRIYNRALNPAEIQTDMNTPVGGS
jgi:hypothetical protein